MAFPIYSTQLVAIQGLVGTHTITPSSSDVCVLRDLDTYFNGLLEQSVHLLGSAGQTIWYNGFSAGGNPQYASWRGRQVINPGESVSITTSDSIDVTLSGYLLTPP